MAIRFGMTIAEMIAQLTRGFRSVTGRNPDGLEKIKIQQEAVQRFKDMNKVVDMQGRTLDPSKTIMGGTQEGAALRSGIMKATGTKPKPVTSLDDPIKRVYEREKKAGKFKNIRLRDGRKIESEEDFREYIDELNEDSNFADGGRIGYKDGPDQPGRRKFMKIIGGLAALPIVGKFFKGAKVAAPAAQAVKETVQQAPNYFFELADKIRRLGRESKVSPQERVREINYKGKDGSEYTLTEDMTTGDMQITKDRTGMAYSDEVGGYDVIEDRTVMEYKSGKGMADESTGAKVADEYEEYKVEFDPDGTPADATDVDEITKTEIVKEVTDEAPSIKKAGGGIATMLGE
jgi:hypothetical protein